MKNPNLIPYRVMLHEEKGDKFQIAFDCQAEDDDHAVEQAESAYPGCEIISYLPFDSGSLAFVIYSANESAATYGAGFWNNDIGWVDFHQATRFSEGEKQTLNLPISTGQDAKWALWSEANVSYGGGPSLVTEEAHEDVADDDNKLGHKDWRRMLTAGDEVWWNDPEHGISSGTYTIEFINGDEIAYEDTVLMLKNPAGIQTEVLACELSPAQPAGECPACEALAQPIARCNTCGRLLDQVGDPASKDCGGDCLACMAEAGDPECQVQIHAPDEPQTVRLRLTLDVTYTLNGNSVADMQDRLRQAVEHAIGNGMLTGDSAAEVDEYSAEVVEQPEPLSEDSLANWMTRRIEAGELALEEIPVRLARYGLMEAPAFVAEMRERMAPDS
jgi:hypothetical protein